jgi:aryl-alcohol dehydrogenase-like predicted oxidoreductase
MDRREFLKMTAVAAGMAAVQGTGRLSRAASGELVYRTLGKTGEKVSPIGIGGSHIGSPKNEAEAIRIIRAAIDRGITFMDNCWDYREGVCEARMGKALRDGYRDKVFLMTKIDGRTSASAAKQIDESLQRLQTDHVDLMQIHEVIRLEDPDRCFAPKGTIEALVAAQKAGKIRYIGFTGHKDPIVHLRMLEVAAKNNFRFDAVQMPLNVMDAHFRSFEKQVLPVLVREQIGVLGMKSMGSGSILRSKTVSAVECLHYALNLPTSAVITGIESMERLDQAVEAAQTFKPLTQEQIGALLAKTAQAAANGQFEPFKTTHYFDGTARNPQWLG